MPENIPKPSVLPASSSCRLFVRERDFNYFYRRGYAIASVRLFVCLSVKHIMRKVLEQFL